MRLFLLPLLLAACTLVRAAPPSPEAVAALRAQPVRVCDDVNEWPPYTYRQRAPGPERGELTGYTVELLRLVAARHSLQLEIETLPWSRCQDEVRRGVRLLMLNAIRTPDRERYYWVSTAIHQSRLLYVWSHKQHPKGLGWSRLADLRLLRVGGLQGYRYGQLTASEQTLVQRAPSYASLLGMLELRRVDAMLINEGVWRGLQLLGEVPLANSPDLRAAPVPEREASQFFVMASRERPEGQVLIALIDAEIERLERAGQLAQLRVRFNLPK